MINAHAEYLHAEERILCPAGIMAAHCPDIGSGAQRLSQWALCCDGAWLL
jgi:hypothetical protein